MSRRGSEKVTFDGPAGLLEGLWLSSGSDPPVRTVVLCHPHPLHGGTMESKLVARTARRLAESGTETLRFNFRGVGQSSGAWDEGRGERKDLASALDCAVSRTPDAMLGVFGFSFGALVGLDVGARDERVEALAGVAPPVQWFLPDFLSDTLKPKLIVGAGQDTIVDRWALEAWVDKVHSPKEFRMFDAAGHLFDDEVDQVAALVAAFFAETLA